MCSTFGEVSQAPVNRHATSTYHETPIPVEAYCSMLSQFPFGHAKPVLLLFNAAKASGNTLQESMNTMKVGVGKCSMSKRAKGYTEKFKLSRAWRLVSSSAAPMHHSTARRRAPFLHRR